MSVRAVAVAAAVVVFAVAAPASVATPPQAGKVRAVLVEQARLFKQGQWRAMYATYTPRFRRSCPYARFVALQRANRRVLGTDFALRGIQVRVETATRAIVAYRFVRNGRTLAAVSFRQRDVYAKVGSRWYDQLDRVSRC